MKNSYIKLVKNVCQKSKRKEKQGNISNQYTKTIIKSNNKINKNRNRSFYVKRIIDCD